MRIHHPEKPFPADVEANLLFFPDTGIDLITNGNTRDSQFFLVFLGLFFAIRPALPCSEKIRARIIRPWLGNQRREAGCGRIGQRKCKGGIHHQAGGGLVL
jgi:hypothetical protein